MKSIAFVVVCALASGSCTKYPATSIGITAGAIGFGGCEIDQVQVKDCAIIGAVTGVFFGALVAALYHFTDSSAHELKLDDSLGSGGEVRLHTFTPPPPVPLLDAGVPDAAPDAQPASPDAQPALPDAPP